ncbi:FSTL3 protein, partial [Alca torda]|nr:FSTL3 protein [Alca torda]
GGICWLQQGKEAKCTMILKTGVTWEECCANGNVDVAWSNYTYPGNKISLLGFLGLVTCHPCKESPCLSHPDGAGAAPHGAPACWRPWKRADEPSRARGAGRGYSRVKWLQPPALGQQPGWPSPAGRCCRVRVFFFPAESCSSVVCPGTHTCVVDQTGSAHCVMCRTAPCPEPTSLDHALCGNNNVTYPSACHLRRATCHRGRSIGVRHYGSCSAAARFSPETDNAEENYV